MEQISFNISAAKKALHKERILRLRSDDYQEWLVNNDLTDTNPNQNEYVRVFCMQPVKNLLKRLEKEDEAQTSQVDISKSDLS